jgi:hypothetical protein
MGIQQERLWPEALQMGVLEMADNSHSVLLPLTVLAQVETSVNTSRLQGTNPGAAFSRNYISHKRLG